MKFKIKSAIIIIVLTIILCCDVFNSQETYWDKCDLANVIGDFENSELIEDVGNYQVWIVEQYNSNWIVKIEDGHLISKTEI